MSSQSSIAESISEGNAIDESPPGGPDGGIPGSSKQEGNRSTARLESLIAEQTTTISALVMEIQDTNRLLKTLVSQKAPEVTVPQSSVRVAPEAVPGLRRLPPQENDRISKDPESEEPEEMSGMGKEELKQRLFHDLWKKYFNNPPSPEVMEAYREKFLEGVGHPIDDIRSLGKTSAVIVVESCEIGVDGARPGVKDITWDLAHIPWHYNSPPEGNAAVCAHLRRHWFSGQVEAEHFKLDNNRWVWYTWLKYEDPQLHFSRLSASLLCYVPGSTQIQALEGVARRWDGRGDLTNPGAFWFLEPGAYLANVAYLIPLLAQCVLGGLRWPEYPKGPAAEHILKGLQHFFTSWERLGSFDPRYPVDRDFFDEQYYWVHHDIRMFSSPPIEYPPTSEVFLKFHREGGKLPNLQDSYTLSCSEKRLSVMFMSGPGNGDPSFCLLLMTDFLSSETRKNMFMNWSERGFTASGPDAGYMLLQSVLHGMLEIWETEWSRCLDEVDKCVSVKLEDILAIKTSEDLMFDDSFRRSRVYFRLLQILRIFFDSVRETGVQLNNMRPENTLISGFDDEAIQDNWNIVVTYQAEVEKRLLQRIMEKTEEIKSLRDGLFNATSLREASKSATMNRYVIVFTIVTVLYLPPSFVATVFGTDLFNSDDTAGTVNKFKNTTIAVSVSTYVIAFLLVLFVDRKRILPRTYTYIKKLSTQLSEYWEKKKTKGNNEGEGGIFANGVSWIRNFNFKLPRFRGMRRRNTNVTSEPDIELRP